MYRIVAYIVGAASDASFLAEHWERVKAFLNSPWAMLLALALIAFAVFRPERREVPAHEITQYRTATPTAEVLRLPTMPGKPERVLVDVTLDYLMSLFKGRTDAQARKLVDDYLGKWMKVTGTVRNVGSQISFWSVYFSDTNVQAYFRDKKWRDRLLILRPGERITVVGKIDRIERVSIELENCELVDS